MGKNYKQLTYEDRIALCHLVRAGISKPQIAKQLNCHRTTIYRELKRNGTRIGYLPIVAGRKVKERKKRYFKLKRDKALNKVVFSRLKLGWSPEQIAGRLKLENNGLALISHETIYAYIYSNYGLRNQWHACLRRKRLHRYPKVARQKRHLIPDRTPISKRPIAINERQNFGHWEGDLMVFQQCVKTNIITLRERKSRFIIAIKNENRKAVGTAGQIIHHLKTIKDKVLSITYDNGPEFSSHTLIKQQLNTQHYFCEPYKSWQKGAIENANSLLREAFPRNIDINKLTQVTINKVVAAINRRPMKCLGYQTPKEVFDKAI